MNELEARLRKRNAELIEQERVTSKGATGFWYLSYAGEDGFRGGVILRAFGFVHACQRARDLHITPGGQIHGIPVPIDEVPVAKYLDRLLTLEELGEFWEMCQRKA